MQLRRGWNNYEAGKSLKAAYNTHGEGNNDANDDLLHDIPYLRRFAESRPVNPWRVRRLRRRRILILALCNCELDVPIEQPRKDAISLCSNPSTSWRRKTMR